MSFDDYWCSSNYSLFYAYQKAYNNQLDIQREQINFQTWIQGSYISSAIADLFRKDGTQSVYPSSPIDFKEIERKSLLTDAERANEELLETIAYEEKMRIENLNRVKNALRKESE